MLRDSTRDGRNLFEVRTFAVLDRPMLPVDTKLHRYCSLYAIDIDHFLNSTAPQALIWSLQVRFTNVE